MDGDEFLEGNIPMDDNDAQQYPDRDTHLVNPPQEYKIMLTSAIQLEDKDPCYDYGLPLFMGTMSTTVQHRWTSSTFYSKKLCGVKLLCKPNDCTPKTVPKAGSLCSSHNG